MKINKFIFLVLILISRIITASEAADQQDIFYISGEVFMSPGGDSLLIQSKNGLYRPINCDFEGFKEGLFVTFKLKKLNPTGAFALGIPVEIISISPPRFCTIL